MRQHQNGRYIVCRLVWSKIYCAGLNCELKHIEWIEEHFSDKENEKKRKSNTVKNNLNNAP